MTWEEILLKDLGKSKRYLHFSGGPFRDEREREREEKKREREERDSTINSNSQLSVVPIEQLLLLYSRPLLVTWCATARQHPFFGIVFAGGHFPPFQRELFASACIAHTKRISLHMRQKDQKRGGNTGGEKVLKKILKFRVYEWMCLVDNKRFILSIKPSLAWAQEIRLRLVYRRVILFFQPTL